LEKKVLLVNLDLGHVDGLGTYFETDGAKTLVETVSNSYYLSEAIQQTQYENLDVIALEEVGEPEFIEVLNTRDIKSKLNPLKNYYDLVLIIGDRKSTRLNSSHVSISYAVFCLKKISV